MALTAEQREFVIEHRAFLGEVKSALQETRRITAQGEALIKRFNKFERKLKKMIEEAQPPHSRGNK